MGRIVIWSLFGLVGYLCLHLVIGVFLIQSSVRSLMESLPNPEGANVIVYQHDTYCKIAGIRTPLHPHPWAAVLVGVGFGLVVLGLVFLLHVPVKDPM